MDSRLLVLIFILIIGQGCMKDDELWDFNRLQLEKSNKGLFIINEGNFTYDNASLTYYDLETGEVYDDVFFNTNALPLGDVAFSMTIRDTLGYIVLNNSGRIYVIDAQNFGYVGKITGLTSPRHMHFISDTKAYVTDLYARSIAVVNPVTMEVTGSVDVNNYAGEFHQHPTEQMVQYDRYIYTNCWSFDNKILVIDSELDEVVDSIEVLKQPNSMVLDKYHNLWILSDGGFPESPYGYEVPGLMKIAPGSDQPAVIHRFEQGQRPSELCINGHGDTLYFLNNHVYRLPLNTASGPELYIASPYDTGFSGGFYGLAVDQSNSEVYVSDAIDFTQRGIVYRFSAAGEALDTIRSGIIPGSFCFK